MADYELQGEITTNTIDSEILSAPIIESEMMLGDTVVIDHYYNGLETDTVKVTVDNDNNTIKADAVVDEKPTKNSNHLVTSGGVHDYPAISFAEGEYQKSKNLFYDPTDNNITHSGITFTSSSKNQEYTFNGTSTEPTAYSSTGQNIAKLLSGKTYVLSCRNAGGSRTLSGYFVLYLYCKDTSGNSLTTIQLSLGGSNTIYTTTITPAVDTIISGYNFDVASSNSYDNYKLKIQIEENSTATDWQFPYGAITHNGDTAVAFAESEYQKSKNLFNAPSITLPTGVTYNSSTNTFTYTSDEVADGATKFVVLNKVVMPAGNYVYSFDSTSTITGDTTYIVAKLNSAGAYESQIATKVLPAGKVSIPFTLTEDTYIGLCWYYKTGWSAGSAPAGSKTISNVQLEQGSTATDYQPYYGAIVHQGELPQFKFYPVGSIYISISSTSPASLFGGTWEELASNNTLWIIPTTDSSGGGTIDAGLPNITASLNRLSGSVYWPSDSTYGGAFSLSQVGSHKVPTGSSSNYSSGELQFSASKSNSIYGNSTTVQPPAIKVYAWKRVE